MARVLSTVWGERDDSSTEIRKRAGSGMYIISAHHQKKKDREYSTGSNHKHNHSAIECSIKQ